MKIPTQKKEHSCKLQCCPYNEKSEYRRKLDGHGVGMVRCDCLFTVGYIIIHYIARCSCWLSRCFFAKITTHEYFRTVKTTKWFATQTWFRIICSIVKILKRQTVLVTFNSVEKGVWYNIRKSLHHFGPPSQPSNIQWNSDFGFGPLNVCGLTGRSL